MRTPPLPVRVYAHDDGCFLLQENPNEGRHPSAVLVPWDQTSRVIDEMRRTCALHDQGLDQL